MKKLVKATAAIVRDLETLDLVGEENITTDLSIDFDTSEFELAIGVYDVSEAVIKLCEELFQERRGKDYEMRLVKNLENGRMIMNFWKK